MKYSCCKTCKHAGLRESKGICLLCGDGGYWIPSDGYLIAKAIKENANLNITHAKWIGKPIAGYSTVRCSNCKSVFRENNGRWKYCPECGAKMDLK